MGDITLDPDWPDALKKIEYHAARLKAADRLARLGGRMADWFRKQPDDDSRLIAFHWDKAVEDYLMGEEK